MKQEYNQNSIKVLSDLEHIQTRPQMYIGENNNPHQLVSEIIDNAIDEVQAGFSDYCDINIDTKNNIYSVRDYGRGIPHGKKKLDDGSEKEVLEVLLTKSNSGGKFNNESYNFSSGLHGLGITITNALSEFIEITSYRNHKFVKAVAKSSLNVDLTYGESDEPSGTLVVFKPNKKYFVSDVIPTDFILSRCKVSSALGFKCNVYIDGVEQKSSYSIFDLIGNEQSGISTYINISPIEVISSTKERMKTAIRYTSDTTDRYFGFTNLLTNYLGGTHVQELSKTISQAWEEFLNSHKKMKPEIELKPGDFLVGIRAVCAVFIQKPEFSSQTKEKLTVNRKYFEELMEKFKKNFIKYLEENITIAQQLLKRFEEYRIAQNSLLSRKEISSIIKVNSDDSDNIRRRSVVSKLVECTSRKRDNTELFLCLDGETKIALTNGTTPTIRELAENYTEPFEVVSCDEFGNCISATAKNPRVTQKVNFMYVVGLSDGSTIRCTGEHRFLDKNTMKWVMAKELSIYQSLYRVKLNKTDDYDFVRVMSLDIEEVDNIPVYCLTVDNSFHSFALFNGLITHNCEGDSALGPYLYTRDKVTQAVIPLRGKILNVVGKSVKECLKNNEICDIANAIGAGIGNACDASKSRYERIILSADADVDGEHINCLLIALFVNLFPDIVKRGMLYITNPPLYCWGKSNKDFGGCSRIEDIPKSVKEYHRIKGLGEFQNDELKYFLVDKETRNICKVDFPSDIDEFNRIMGSTDGKFDLLKDLNIISYGV